MTLQLDANDVDLELLREREEALHKLEVRLMPTSIFYLISFILVLSPEIEIRFIYQPRFSFVIISFLRQFSAIISEYMSTYVQSYVPSYIGVYCEFL